MLTNGKRTQRSNYLCLYEPYVTIILAYLPYSRNVRREESQKIYIDLYHCGTKFSAFGNRTEKGKGQATDFIRFPIHLCPLCNVDA
ncbi:hypothetical protein P5673_020072 [Acropora cervicornis]|uniref:Uncharacterized protein n=1 Tax=Acropora cervicornis TaxID=6130 RepID=A0AAD9QAH1_ACRCE|nr:hypothetical protein P5673_020072 [Acropora cervicornis]